MFAQSFTGHALKRLVALVGNSFMISLLIRIFVRLKNDFFSSRLLKIMMRIVELVQTAYAGSRFKQFVDSPAYVHNCYCSSMLCSIVKFAFGIAVKLAGSVFGFFERIASGGIIHNICMTLSAKKLFAFHNITLYSIISLNIALSSS